MYLLPYQEINIISELKHVLKPVPFVVNIYEKYLQKF